MCCARQGGYDPSQLAAQPEGSASEGMGEGGKSGEGADWVQMIDPSSNRPYYANQKTGLTSWHHPSYFKKQKAGMGGDASANGNATEVRCTLVSQTLTTSV